MSATALNAESEDWQVSEGEHRSVSLVVQLRRHAFILPYIRFVCAEGNNTELKITFASHRVTVKGNALAGLLAGLATHRINRVIEPSDSEGRFAVRGPSISSITVEEFK